MTLLWSRLIFTKLYIVSKELVLIIDISKHNIQIIPLNYDDSILASTHFSYLNIWFASSFLKINWLKLPGWLKLIICIVGLSELQNSDKAYIQSSHPDVFKSKFWTCSKMLFPTDEFVRHVRCTRWWILLHETLNGGKLQIMWIETAESFK